MAGCAAAPAATTVAFPSGASITSATSSEQGTSTTAISSPIDASHASQPALTAGLPAVARLHTYT